MSAPISFELMDKLGSADDIDGPEPFLFREYDYGSPHSGIRSVLNNPITGLQETNSSRKKEKKEKGKE